MTAVAATFSDDFTERALRNPRVLETRLEGLKARNPLVREASIYTAGGGGRRVATTDDGELAEKVGAHDLEPIRTGESEYKEEHEGETHLAEISFPLQQSGRDPIASLGLYYDLAPLDAALARDKRILTIGVGFFALLAAIFVAFWLRRSVLYPLDRIGQAARRIGAGETHLRLDWKRTDELGALATHFDGMASELEETHRSLEALAIRDGLTGLFNHGAFQEALATQVKVGDATGSVLSVLAIDVDSFKEINDSRGHAAGDEALRGVAQRIAAEGRPDDIYGRVGGDEFAVVLLGARAEDAERFAARVRKGVGAMGPGGPSVTVSVGIAEFPAHGSDVDELLTRADAAMYSSKRGGRDRVAIFFEGIELEITPERVEARARDDMLVSTVHALAAAVDAKDGYTHEHSGRVATYSTRLAMSLGISDRQITALRRAAILHDIGKIGIRDSILLKPARLTASEFEEMKRHSSLGADIIAGAGMIEEAEWVRHLHERWDGAGYPAGLSGEDIPLLSRILHAADTLEAITSGRVYRDAQSLEFALFEIEANAGTQLDPTVADQLAVLLRSGALRADAPRTAEPARAASPGLR